MMNLAVDCYRVSLIKRLKLVMHHFHSVLWFHVQIDSINQHLNEIGSLICDENFTIKILLAPHYSMIFTWANNILNLCFATWKHFNWNSFRFESFYLEWNDLWNLLVTEELLVNLIKFTNIEISLKIPFFPFFLQWIYYRHEQKLQYELHSAHSCGQRIVWFLFHVDRYESEATGKMQKAKEHSKYEF